MLISGQWLLLTTVLITALCSSFHACWAFSVVPYNSNSKLVLRAENIPSPESPVVESLKNKADTLKDDLIALADKTRRGFSASKDERSMMKQIINELSSCSPTEEPAAAYYKGEENSGSNIAISTLSGKWTLIYTDAPDITSLEGGPLSELLCTSWPEETPIILGINHLAITLIANS